MKESELREQGLQWDNVEQCFFWNELSKDFMRQLVEYDTCYKTQLENHLLGAFHGFAEYPSDFYQNMYNYIKYGLAEQKELAYYADKVYDMYITRKRIEESCRQRFQAHLIDYNGTILNTITY